MKTAMQQMIKATNSAISSVDPKDVHVGLVLEAVKYKANKLLEAEKQQIMEAFNNGANWELYGSDITQDERADKYYQQTFNPE